MTVPHYADRSGITLLVHVSGARFRPPTLDERAAVRGVGEPDRGDVVLDLSRSYYERGGEWREQLARVIEQFGMADAAHVLNDDCLYLEE